MKKNPIPSWVIEVALYTSILACLYFSTFSWLLTHDWIRGDYNYCYLIPPIVLYLLWEKRDLLAATPSSPSWAGFVPLVSGIILFFAGELAGEFFTQYLSFWLIVVGLAWVRLGWHKLKVIWFPLVFMLTMFPLPNFINTRITLKLKLLSSQLGVWLLQAWGMSAFREGNIINLGFTQLQVVDACSGLRFLFPLIILGILLLYFYRISFWKGLVVLISIIPLTVVTNSLRIALTGVLYRHWGPEAAEGFFHGLSGWLIFMFSLVILLLEITVLNKVFPGAGKETISGKEREKARGVEERKDVMSHTGKGMFLPQTVAAMVLLGAALGLSQGIEFHEKIPLRRSFAEFPLRVGKWKGRHGYLEQKIIESLDLSDYVIINYEDPVGRVVNFYVAYYESQSKGKSIHSPGTCLPGSGWIFLKSGIVTVSTPGYNGGHIKVRRVLMQKGASMQITYYWFLLRRRIVTDAYQVKLYNFLDALTRHRTDGALIRIITPVYDGETVHDADTRLQDFIKEVVPRLSGFLG